MTRNRRSGKAAASRKIQTPPPSNELKAGSSAQRARRSREGSLDETDLIERVRCGDEQAFAEIVDRYRDRVHRLVYGLLRDAHEAEDVTQEVFIKAFYRISSFKGNSAFYTWLYRVAVNAATDWRKKWRKRKGLSLDEGPTGAEGLEDERPSPEREVENRELGEKIDQAIDSLPEKYRSILVLREYEGLSYEEISRVLSLKKGTVESRLFRARKRLEELLGPYL